MKITGEQKRGFADVVVEEVISALPHGLSMEECALLLGFTQESGRADITEMVPGAPTRDDLVNAKWERDGGNRNELIVLRRMFKEEFEKGELYQKALSLKKDSLRESILKEIESALEYLEQTGGHHPDTCLLCRSNALSVEWMMLPMRDKANAELADRRRVFSGSLNPGNLRTDGLIHRIIAFIGGNV